MIEFNLKLHFARGYYDGRLKGFEDVNYDNLTEEEKYQYSSGYDAGVTDYCLLDEDNA